MRSSRLGVALIIIVITAAAANGQGLSDERRDSIYSPRSPGLSGVPDSSRTREFTPESHVPCRSPDLGSAYFPLSPSIGPGSGSLGPAAGPDASQRRSSMETDTERARERRRTP
jgi:hypothetical protein